ncbi:MAG: hypothetical protein QGG40_11135 [Myxococcota bacterium]|nr:hypothetical protein [Myxococcota bacterium]
MKRPSTLTLHRYRYGELSESETRDVEMYLQSHPEDAQRLHAQQSFREKFESRPVPAQLLVEPDRRAWWQWMWAPAFAVAAASFMLFVETPVEHGGTADLTGMSKPVPETVRAKGFPSPVVWIKDRGQLDLDSMVSPGDRLQVQVPAGGWTRAWVGDQDDFYGHFDLEPDAMTSAPFSLLVDDADIEETLVIVLSKEPLEAEQAREVVEGIRIEDVSLTSIPLRKSP